MLRTHIQPAALTVGQLAKRWAVSVDRVRKLVELGLLPGAFRIPSAGRYGATVKIPLDAVRKAESDWAITPSHVTKPQARRRKNRDTTPALKHFPELIDGPERVAECHGGAGR